MIKKEFWEKVAEVWTKKEEIDIPPIDIGIDVPDDFIDLDEVEDWEALMKDLLGSDEEGGIDLSDLLSDE